jgi:hypothetical protein
LHHIIDNPLFAPHFYLFLFSCLFPPIDRRVESELLENFQELDFEDLEQQQVGFEGKCP